MAKRGERSNNQGLQSIFNRIQFPWSRKQASSYQWGWHHVAPVESTLFAAATTETCDCTTEDSDEEADLSGWEHCGVMYGNGTYDDGEED